MISIGDASAGELSTPARNACSKRCDPANNTSRGGTFLAMDLTATSATTQELLGWTPTGPSLIEDIDMGGYSSR
jgi:hypothetical protein